MDSVRKFFQENYEWVFSGLGVYILGAIASIIMLLLFRKFRSGSNVTQKNIVAGGDVVGRDKKG